MFNSVSSVGILLGSVMLAFGGPLAVYAVFDLEYQPRDYAVMTVALSLIGGGAAALVWRRHVSVPVRHLALCWMGIATIVCVWSTRGDSITHNFAASISAVVLLAFAIVPSRVALWYPAVLIPAAGLALAFQPGMEIATVAMSGLLAVGTGLGLTWFARSAVTADTDWLTGVRNFAGFERAVNILVRDAQPGTLITLCRIDLDEFVLVNQRHGHAAGDEALIRFTAQLTNSLPASVILGRIEGDAFALLFPGTTAGDAQAHLETLSATVMSFSTGIASHDADESASELFGRAGIALYDAKRAGFGHVSIHGGYYASVRVVRQAIANDEFNILYQPCVDMRSGRAVGAEALVRWNHPTRGLLSPAEFIPLCEASGSINILGGWVLAQAITAAAHWNKARPRGQEPISVAVNASARELMSPGYGERAVALCEAAGLDVSSLGIEATESDYGTASHDVMVNTEMLRTAGVAISMDDFGTGFSNLERLTRMRLDVLKIDRGFIKTIGSRSDDAPLPDLAIRLGTAMSLAIIAEGVETREQADWLIERGCYLAQGYLYARPLILDDFVRDWVNVEPDVNWWFSREPALPRS